MVKNKQRPRSLIGKAWFFIWEDNSVLSWVVNVVLAFVLIKFLVYPGLGLVLETSHPIVAVVSNSMEHKVEFDSWWSSNHLKYRDFNITKEDFDNFPLKNGFNKGDLIILHGKEPPDQKIGDIIVFSANQPDPIIHRVIDIREKNGRHFTTMGDNNKAIISVERDIKETQVIGNALIRVPVLGYVKIIFVDLLKVMVR